MHRGKKHPKFCWSVDDPPYVKNRLGRYINYFFYEKDKSRRKERIYQYSIIIIGALIPIINVIGLETLPVNYASAILGASVSGLTAVLSFEKYHERWLSFKRAATKLANEYYMWKNVTGSYIADKGKQGSDILRDGKENENKKVETSKQEVDIWTPEVRLAHLVKRCEEIIMSEAFDYVQLFSANPPSQESSQSE